MINLMKYRYLFFLISGIFLIPGIVSLITFGLRPAIDFTGGTLLELQVDSPKVNSWDQQQWQELISDDFRLSSVLPAGENRFILRGNTIDKEQKAQVLAKITPELGEVQEIRFETVGPILGKELLKKTFFAITLAALLILFYVGWQFSELKYGVCAILAMLHDSLILVGAFSLLGHFYQVEVDVLFVTAVLTTLSFSIHDTIVVFDRIREHLRKDSSLSLTKVANVAVLETLGRSVNNSITIILMLLALVLLGGETIRWFSVALLIGAITGTYSSTFTAVPLLVVWEKLARRVKK